MQGKRLRLRVNPVDAVFRHDAVIISDVQYLGSGQRLYFEIKATGPGLAF
jgi:hypothetical protein